MSELISGDWRIVPGDCAYYREQPVITAASLVDIMHSIASRNGELVARQVLAREAYCPNPASAVAMIRNALRKSGAPDPIVSRNADGPGYRWRGTGA